MTDFPNGIPSEQVPEGRDDDQRAVRELLKSALAAPQDPPHDVLKGVQRKLRQRSRGKFYTDRWSTEKNPPINTYLITSLLMLFILIAAYSVLRPLSGASTAVKNEPAPVHIVVPAQR